MVEVKVVDAHGRLLLPLSWRKKLKSREVIVIEDGDILVVIPKDDPDLSKYAGYLSADIPPEAYSDYHELKKYLLGRSSD